MPGTKKRIMSVSVDPEIVDVLDEIKKVKKESRSQVIENMVGKFSPVIDDDKLDKMIKGYINQLGEDNIPIVLYIPSHLTDNPDELKNWLHTKFEATCNVLTA